MINRFTGQYRFLSNFYPIEIEQEGMKYPTVEHAYQAAKTVFSLDKLAIQLCKTPGEAKCYGRKVRLRTDWEDIKLRVMRNLISQKFRDVHLNLKLLATKNEELIEGNNWGDTFWGVCNGVGENHLGKILMDVRSRLI